MFQTPTRDALRQAKFMAFLLNWLRQNNIRFTFKYDLVGNLYITKGNSAIFPCIVSHVDTVHDYNKDMAVANTNTLIFGIDQASGEQIGIGADPKNGVYFALQMLKYLKSCKVVFFVNEECGCLGSKEADLTFFSDCSFVCQLDRRSFTTDIIEYTNGIQVLSEEFKQAVELTCIDYGYDFNHGTSTDVGELVWNGLGICAFNFSNGSFNEHCSYEVCSIPHLLNACNAAYEIIMSHGYSKRWLHQPYTDSRYNWNTWGGWDDAGYGTAKPKSTYYDKYDELFDTKDVDDYSKTVFDITNIASFVKDHVFKAKAGQKTAQAALKYVYDIDDVESFIWTYDYHVGSNCDEVEVCKNLISYLKANFNYLQEVKSLIRGLKEYQEMIEDQIQKALPSGLDDDGSGRCSI